MRHVDLMRVKNRLIVFKEKLRLNSLKYLKILNNQVCDSRNMELKGLQPKEIVEKVRSGVIKSCEYKSFSEYVKAMEE